MVKSFPPVELADPESGLLAIGGDLEVETLRLAYGNGIFPWPVEDQPLMWYAPAIRPILDFDKMKIPLRFRRTMKKIQFEFRVNTNFVAVITGCADTKNRGHGKGTWITPEMLEAYVDLHKAGNADSFESYNRKGELVGGMYGVHIEKFFAGESMFYLESGASKFALVKAVEYLRALGTNWLDIQMMTPLLKSFGAREIPRREFMRRLRQAIKDDGPFKTKL
jgi:leucyl/phenylalanyl-tRNA--protein transferase